MFWLIRLHVQLLGITTHGMETMQVHVQAPRYHHSDTVTLQTVFGILTSFISVSPDITLCGWLGSKHQPTNSLISVAGLSLRRASWALTILFPAPAPSRTEEASRSYQYRNGSFLKTFFFTLFLVLFVKKKIYVLKGAKYDHECCLFP